MEDDVKRFIQYEFILQMNFRLFFRIPGDLSMEFQITRVHYLVMEYMKTFLNKNVKQYVTVNLRHNQSRL